MSTIEDKAKFDFIRYASVWEDADILCEALEPRSSGGRFLSIASSGDNALALLTLDPDEVVAVDINPTQIASIEIRKAAFQILNYDEVLAFLGVEDSKKRLQTYDRLRKLLSPPSQEFWDRNQEVITQGIIHVGKFEKYLNFFGLKILPWLHSKEDIEELIAEKSLEEQTLFYEKKWDTWLWRLLFKVFFSKTVMGKKGRDPAFFDHVHGSIAKHILDRTHFAFTNISTHSNPYLTFIVTGNYRKNALPRYLRQEFFEQIKRNIEKLTIVTGHASDVKDKRFDGFNLSDIFEYMNQEEAAACYESLVEQSNPGARLVYWNMRVPRSCPTSMREKVQHLDELSRDLHRRDKAWFYSAFRVDEVKLREEVHA